MAVHQFADFELNEELHQLRLRGEEVALQPRAFEVLAYLINNRSRVVDKDELLETLWPGVIVTDSSLQRAVSLARSALRSGGLDDAIRTYAKRGYRFMRDVPPRAGPVTSGDSGNPLDEAYAFVDRGRWADAAAAFERADGHSRLAPRDLENWGMALQCAARAPAAREPFERAAEAFSAADECESAARAVISLARIHFETREWSVTRGCLRRAANMLDRLPLCEQHGHHAWMTSWLASYEGDLAAMLEHARKAWDIGRRLDNVDVEAMGLLFWGMALQASGDAKQGLELQDEAGAAVLTGSVTPLLGGLVYCGLLGGCCNTGDWPRAGEWCETFTGWCRRNGMQRFSGPCLLHRVEVFIARGELDRAESELQEGGETIEMSSASVGADAKRFLADVLLLRGEFDKAETAYRAAYESGSDPHPGYALLLQRRGQPQAAIRALRRCAEGVAWASRERKPLYLAFAATIAAQSGDTDTALEIIGELERHPDSWTVGTTRAHVQRAKAEACFAQRDPEQAVRLFRDALRTYQDMDAPLEAAQARLRLADALLAVGDPGGAVLELESADAVLARSEARLFLDDCRKLRAALADTQIR
jgi:DNA-binding winged helix-turn-helix (wHTH) protein